MDNLLLTRTPFNVKDSVDTVKETDTKDTHDKTHVLNVVHLLALLLCEGLILLPLWFSVP